MSASLIAPAPETRFADWNMPNWYAISTRVNQEKHVAEGLDWRGIQYRKIFPRSPPEQDFWGFCGFAQAAACGKRLPVPRCMEYFGMGVTGES